MADALRRRAANEIDWQNVAEEIESLARSERQEIRNRLAMRCSTTPSGQARQNTGNPRNRPAWSRRGK
jgi:hypothetical protein